VVDTIIFSSKAKNYIYLTYLLYLRDIELINMYERGLANHFRVIDNLGILIFVFKKIK
jgi:hypothetical protein